MEYSGHTPIRFSDGPHEHRFLTEVSRTTEGLTRRTGPLSSIMHARNLVNLSICLADNLNLYGRLYGQGYVCEKIRGARE